MPGNAGAEFVGDRGLARRLRRAAGSGANVPRIITRKMLLTMLTAALLNGSYVWIRMDDDVSGAIPPQQSFNPIVRVPALSERTSNAPDDERT
jgi:hypothetical protein